MINALRAATSAEDLKPSPIPQSWIVDGKPEARASLLARSRDGTMTTSHWDCSAGAFQWHFGCEETVYILEGEVHVRDEAGESFTLRPGDVALFHAGSQATWTVPVYVRKLAVCRVPMPGSIGFCLRVWRKIAQLLVPPRALPALALSG